MADHVRPASTEYAHFVPQCTWKWCNILDVDQGIKYHKIPKNHSPFSNIVLYLQTDKQTFMKMIYFTYIILYKYPSYLSSLLLILLYHIEWNSSTWAFKKWRFKAPFKLKNPGGYKSLYLIGPPLQRKGPIDSCLSVSSLVSYLLC